MVDDVKFGELSARSASIQRELGEFKTDTHKELEEVKKELRDIKLLLSKWKGFVGGIVAVVSLAWGVGVYITNSLTKGIDLL